jgi:hypothetical protein
LWAASGASTAKVRILVMSLTLATLESSTASLGYEIISSKKDFREDE